MNDDMRAVVLDIIYKSPLDVEISADDAELFNTFSPEVIIPLLQQCTIDLSAQEIEALNIFSVESIIPMLEQILNTEKNPTSASRAYEAILSIQEFDSVGFLSDLLDQASSVDSQIGYCSDLSRFPNPRALSKLCDILINHLDPDVRYTAAESLGIIGDSTTVQALEYAQEYDVGKDYEGFPISEVAGEALQQIRNRINGKEE